MQLGGDGSHRELRRVGLAVLAALAAVVAVFVRTGDVIAAGITAGIGVVGAVIALAWRRVCRDNAVLEREVNQAHIWHADAESVFLNGATPTFVLDQDMVHVARVNERGAALFGAGPATIEGGRTADVFGIDTDVLVAAADVAGQSISITTPSGRREFDVLAEQTRHDADWRWIVQLIDLTDERRMQRVLRSERDAIDRVVSRLAHDLRAPIATVVNMSELLVSDRASTRRTQLQLAGRIALSARQVLALADDLMADAESGGIRYGTISLPTVISRCVSVFDEALDAADTAVTIDVDAVGDVALPPSLVRTIVLHLIDNAIRRRHPARPFEIAVRAEVVDGELVLTVSDNGLAIAAHDRAGLFEPDDAAPHPVSGIGLGGCRELARSHGGDLTARAARPYGSTFTLRMPIGDTPDDEPVSTAPALVDDDLSELALRRRLDQASDFGVAVLDDAGQTIFRSGAGLGPLGFDPLEDDIRLIERVHVDDLPAVLNARSMAIECPAEVQRVVCRAQHRDGRWVQIELALTFDPQVSEDGMIVTWRVRAETVAVSESLFDHVPIALLAGGAGGRLIRANSEARALFGWEGEIRADKWTEVIPDDRTRRSVHEAACGGHSGTFEWEYGDLALRGQIAPVGSNIGAWLLLVSDVSGTVLARREILRLARLVESSRDAVIATDLAGRVTAWNPAAEELFGWTQDEMLGQTLERTIPDGEVDPADGAEHHDARRTRRDGSTFWASVSDAPVLEDGVEIGVVHTIVDTTALHTMMESQRITLEALSDGVAVTDRNGDISLANPAMHDLIGVEHDSLIGASLPEGVFGIEPLGQWRPHVVTYHHPRTGEERFYRVTHDLLPDDAHLFVLHDTTERELRESELVHRTLHDPLTGLPNRVLLMDRLAAALAREARTRQRTAVLYIDLDRFKPVNDEHGHAAGDHVLRVIAARLGQVCRATDTVGRLGGDEFVMVCDSIASAEDVLAIHDRIHASLTQSIELPDGSKVTVGASVGIAMTQIDEVADPDRLLAAADRALYDVKAERKGGRSRGGAAAEISADA